MNASLKILQAALLGACIMAPRVILAAGVLQDPKDQKPSQSTVDSLKDTVATPAGGAQATIVGRAVDRAVTAVYESMAGKGLLRKVAKTSTGMPGLHIFTSLGYRPPASDGTGGLGTEIWVQKTLATGVVDVLIIDHGNKVIYIHDNTHLTSDDPSTRRHNDLKERYASDYRLQPLIQKGYKVMAPTFGSWGQAGAELRKKDPPATAVGPAAAPSVASRPKVRTATMNAQSAIIAGVSAVQLLSIVLEQVDQYRRIEEAGEQFRKYHKNLQSLIAETPSGEELMWIVDWVEPRAEIRPAGYEPPPGSWMERLHLIPVRVDKQDLSAQLEVLERSATGLLKMKNYLRVNDSFIRSEAGYLEPGPKYFFEQALEAVNRAVAAELDKTNLRAHQLRVEMGQAVDVYLVISELWPDLLTGPQWVALQAAHPGIAAGYVLDPASGTWKKRADFTAAVDAFHDKERRDAGLPPISAAPPRESDQGSGRGIRTISRQSAQASQDKNVVVALPPDLETLRDKSSGELQAIMEEALKKMREIAPGESARIPESLLPEYMKWHGCYWGARNLLEARGLKVESADRKTSHRAAILMPDRFAPGHPMTFSVASLDGNVIPDARVTFTGGDSTETVTTDQDGRGIFSVPVAWKAVRARIFESTAVALAVSAGTSGRPVIQSVTNPITPGGLISIRGNSFDPEPSANLVTINGVPAIIHGAAPNALSVEAPADLPARAKVHVVVIASGEASSPFKADVVTLSWDPGPGTLVTGQKVTRTLRVTGSTARVPIRLIDPPDDAAVSDARGEVRSSGGTSNTVVVRLHAEAPGNYSLHSNLINGHTDEVALDRLNAEASRRIADALRRVNKAQAAQEAEKGADSWKEAAKARESGDTVQAERLEKAALLHDDAATRSGAGILMTLPSVLP